MKNKQIKKMIEKATIINNNPITEKDLQNISKKSSKKKNDSIYEIKEALEQSIKRGTLAWKDIDPVEFQRSLRN